jgi:uncharacterized protein (TIGR02594 family)
VSEPQGSSQAIRPGPIANPLALARTYSGVSERSAAGREQIQGWLAECGLPGADPTETSWCGAFVAHVVRRFPGLMLPAVPLRARAWLRVGQPIPPEYLSRALPGWIVVVLSRGKPPQPGPEVELANGHVGLWAGFDARGKVLVFAGNQSDSACEASFDPARVLGYRGLL